MADSFFLNRLNQSLFGGVLSDNFFKKHSYSIVKFQK